MFWVKKLHRKIYYICIIQNNDTAAVKLLGYHHLLLCKRPGSNCRGAQRRRDKRLVDFKGLPCDDSTFEKDTTLKNHKL